MPSSSIFHKVFCRMRISFDIFRGCMHRDRSAADPVAVPATCSSLNIREEYANAFRTESYTEFWSRVLDLTLEHGAGLKPNYRPINGASTHLPTYRLFVEGLLDPDQPTVTRILANSRTRPETRTLLVEFYSQTANASLLCGLLLRDIDRIRTRYRPLRSAIKSNNPQSISHLLANFNPFNKLTSSQFKHVRSGSLNLLDRLDLNRRRVRSKLRSVTRVKTGLAVFVVVVTISAALTGAFIAVHGLVALVALPALVWSSRRLNRALAQLDAAAKGMYILNRDLDTISRLVERLSDEVERAVGLARLGTGSRRIVAEEVTREIAKNDTSFNQKLDELEEHLYLCFMTINKARGLVMKEILVTN